MADFRPFDECGFPMHIDQMVQEPDTLTPFDREAEWEHYKQCAAIEDKAFMETARGLYETRVQQAKEWVDQFPTRRYTQQEIDEYRKKWGLK